MPNMIFWALLEVKFRVVVRVFVHERPMPDPRAR